MPVQSPAQNPSLLKTGENDELTKSIQAVGKGKPALSLSTFYLFPINSNFAPLVPDTFTRRLGKMHSFPLFINHDIKSV